MSQSLRFECPNCGQPIEADRTLAGAQVVCPGCGLEFGAPHLEPTETNVHEEPAVSARGLGGSWKDYSAPKVLACFAVVVLIPVGIGAIGFIVGASGGGLSAAVRYSTMAFGVTFGVLFTVVIRLLRRHPGVLQRDSTWSIGADPSLSLNPFKFWKTYSFARYFACLTFCLIVSAVVGLVFADLTGRLTAGIRAMFFTGAAGIIVASISFATFRDTFRRDSPSNLATWLNSVSGLIAGVMTLALVQGYLAAWGMNTENNILGAAINQPGAYAVAFDRGGVVRAWDIATEASLPTPPIGGEARSIDIAAEAPLAVVGTDGGEIVVWNYETGIAQNQFRQSGAVSAVALDAVENVVAGSSSGTDANPEGSIRLWNLATKDAVGGPIRVRGPVYQMACAPTGGYLAAAAEDLMSRIVLLYVIDTRSGNIVTSRELMKEVVGKITSVAFSSDGKRLITGASRVFSDGESAGRIEMYELGGGTIKHLQGGQLDSGIHSVAIASDGAHIAAGTANGTIALWDGTLKTLQQTLDIDSSGSSHIRFVGFMAAPETLIHSYGRSLKTLELN